MIPLPPGDIVAHRYRVERRLAGGGMGVVYVAEHVETEQKIALKVLIPDVAGSQEALERFRLEASVFAKLSSDHIVRVFDAGIDEERRVGFIAMELLEGETLHDRASRAPLDPETLVTLFVQIASALDRAHAYVDKDGAVRPIVHRDLKPENIFITTPEEGKLHAKVLDFGIAKIASATAAVSTELRGTPQYMACEQVEGDAVTPRTDVAALGLIAFFCLTGKSYWKTANEPGAILVAVVRELIKGASVPASERAKELGVDVALPTAFDAWFARAVDRDPEKRFASAGEAAIALADAFGIAAKLPKATPAPTPARITPPSSSPTQSGDPALPLASTVHAKSRSRAAPVVAAIAIVAASIVAWRVTTSTPTPTPTPTPTTTSTSTSKGIPITDHPPPKTTNPDAASAYAAALRDFRNGAMELAGNDFARAAKLDPTMAAAHVRLALFPYDLTPTQFREALAAAERFRSSLDERDQALLGVAEPLNADPPDFVKTAERARAAADRFPTDAEVAYVVAMVTPFVDRIDETRAQVDRAVALDPEFAGAISLLGWWEYQMKRFDESFAAYERCLALAPTASTCLMRRAELHEARGECAAFEVDARRLTQMEPKLPRGHEFLARALAARNAPIESVRIALDRMVETGADVSANYSRSFERFSLAMLVGDLTDAAAAVRSGERELAGHPDEIVQGQIAQVLSVIAREIGDEAEAKRIREDFERRSSAWTKDFGASLRAPRLVDLHRAGQLSDAEFDAQRDTLYREALARSAPPTGSIGADWIWLYVYVTPGLLVPESPAEIADAMKRINAHPPLFDEFGELGFVFVPAKQYARAIPSLRRSTGRCTVMPESVWSFTQSTLWFLKTNLLLGEALENTGDKAGACDAYAVVTERWKDAKPRSVTLEKSRAHAKALGCPK